MGDTFEDVNFFTNEEVVSDLDLTELFNGVFLNDVNEEPFKNEATNNHKPTDINKSFDCTVEGCGKSFKNQRKFKRHMRVHAAHKYQCDVCGKTFMWGSKLKVHNRLHTGEKQFKCPFEGCGKLFTLQHNLKRHYKIHTGIRPYVCPEINCGKAFNRLCTLAVHAKIHARSTTI